jgi:hypothetical protein
MRVFANLIKAVLSSIKILTAWPVSMFTLANTVLLPLIRLRRRPAISDAAINLAPDYRRPGFRPVFVATPFHKQELITLQRD